MPHLSFSNLPDDELVSGHGYLPPCHPDGTHSPCIIKCRVAEVVAGLFEEHRGNNV
jgi:hypothetical protein